MTPAAAPDPLSELERLAQAATPGPWHVSRETQGYPNDGMWWIDELELPIGSEAVPEAGADAALIVAAVNNLPALIARVRALQNIEQAAQQYIDWTGDHHWRCEYRTAAVGWKEGEPPIIRCVCGRDALRAALDAQLPKEPA